MNWISALALERAFSSARSLIAGSFSGGTVWVSAGLAVMLGACGDGSPRRLGEEVNAGSSAAAGSSSDAPLAGAAEASNEGAPLGASLAPSAIVSACGGAAPAAGDAVVNLLDLHQNIAGFGASTAWSSKMSEADADLLWSTQTGAGLSLHRIRIDYQNGHTSELAIAKLAAARGVSIWATPWTPPGADKAGGTGTGGSVGGTLSDGPAFATFLAGFVTYMQGQGVSIAAVSAQNEPDAKVTYESCSYTGATLASFIGTYMGPAFANSGVKIVGPETQNWNSFSSFERAILGDANAAGFTSILATHEYGGRPQAHAEIAQAGKEFWETEIYDTNMTPDAGMGSALRVAKLIHDALTIASVNAWHYWWVYPSANDNQGLWDQSSAQPSKRLWVEGNFARFVRPGFQRVGTTGTLPAGVLLSAYANPLDGTVAIVAINNNASPTTLPVFISGAAPCSLTPWVTSASLDLASGSAIDVASARFSVSLAAQSVTTLAGRP